MDFRGQAERLGMDYMITICDTFYMRLLLMNRRDSNTDQVYVSETESNFVNKERICQYTIERAIESPSRVVPQELILNSHSCPSNHNHDCMGQEFFLLSDSIFVPCITNQRSVNEHPIGN